MTRGAAPASVVREIREGTESSGVLPQHGVDRGCRKAAPLERARGRRIGNDARLGSDSRESVAASRALVRLPLGDLRGRDVAIHTFPDELADQARVTEGLAFALQEKARKETVVHEAVALASLDGLENLFVRVTLALEPAPELRFGQSLARE